MGAPDLTLAHLVPAVASTSITALEFSTNESGRIAGSLCSIEDKPTDQSMQLFDEGLSQATCCAGCKEICTV